MNTKAQTTVSLTADQVRNRLTQLAQRAFRSVIDDAELELLVTTTTRDGAVFTLAHDIWDAIFRHHGYGPVAFDSDAHKTYPDYHKEAWHLHDRLAALAAGQTFGDQTGTFDDTDNPYAEYARFMNIVERGGELVDYACSTVGSMPDPQAIVEALGSNGARVVRSYFVDQWFYHPIDLGITLAARGFGRDVRTLHALSLAIITSVNQYRIAETDAEKSALYGVIDLLWPLLKGLVYATTHEENSAAIEMSSGDATVTLVEQAIRDGHQAIFINAHEAAAHFRKAVQPDANVVLHISVDELLEAFRGRIARQDSLRRGIWD